MKKIYELKIMDYDNETNFFYFKTKKQAMQEYAKKVKEWPQYNADHDYIGINEITLKEKYKNFNPENEYLATEFIENEIVIIG